MRRGIALVIVAAAGVWTAVLLSAGQASPGDREMRVAILVDTGAGTSSGINFVRTSVGAFVDALPAGPELLLASIGRRAQIRVPPTVDRKKIKDSANGLIADGGPTRLMDALVEIDQRFMRKIDNRTPVFVILTSDGSENSVDATGEAFTTWVHTLAPRKIWAHAVVLKSGSGLPEAIARMVTSATGGQFETIGNAGLLPEKMTGVAQRIALDREHLIR